MKGTVTNSIKGAFRIGQTVSVLGRTGVNWLRGDRPPTPRLLRQTFESLGATYIKLGQFIASSVFRNMSRSSSTASIKRLTCLSV